MSNPILPSGEDNPAWISPEVAAQEPAVTLCRDLLGGTERLREQQIVYLPKFEVERDAQHRARVNRSVLFNAFERTLDGLLGMVFRRNPEVDEDVPEVIEKHLENIDLAGTHLDLFAWRHGFDALCDGHAGVFVDYPPMVPGASLADERASGARPYWCLVRKSQIVSFRTANVGGRTVITQLVLCYERVKPKGDYVTEAFKEYRVYRRQPNGPPTFEVYEARDDKPVLVNNGVITNQTEIPFAVTYGRQPEAVLVSKPPLLDLAYLNLAHFQTGGDRRTAIHLTCNPTPVRIGYTGDEGAVKTGGSYLLDLPTGGDFKWSEPAGNGLDAARQQLEDDKAEMATLGLAMLQRETRAAETAEGKRLDRSASDSALAVFARGLQDTLENCLQFHANYLKLPEGGSILVNRDFESLTMDPAMVQTLSNLVGAGQMSLETMWAKLAEGEVLPENFDPEKEKAAIAAEMPRPEDDEPDGDEGDDEAT